MKTTEWFSTFEEPYQSQAISNYNCRNIDYDSEQETASVALTSGFIFSKTPEGYDYWNEYLRKVRFAEMNPLSIEARLLKLPEPYRTQALNNVFEKRRIVHSDKQALKNAFNWAESPEGKSYWLRVYLTL